MLLKRILVSVAALAAVTATSLTTAGVANADPEIAGTYNSVSPTRVLDTRSGVGAPDAQMQPGATLNFNPTEGIDGTAGAVALTITVVSPTERGYLIVSPTGGARPTTSTVNFSLGQTTVNSTIVTMGEGDQLTIFNGSAGTVDVLADLTGWWTAGTPSADTPGALTTVTPARIFDSRTAGGRPIAGKTNTAVPVLGRGGVPAANVSAVAINLTVTVPQTAGFLSAGAELAQPDALTSTLNFQKSTSRANLTVVPVNPDGTISVYNAASGTVHFIVDVLAYVYDGAPAADGAFLPSTSFRAADTRVEGGAMPALTTRKLALLPDDGTAFIFKAVEVNITVATPQASGYLTAWDGTTGVPPTSNNNFVSKVDNAMTTIVPVNPDGTISIYNGSYGNLNVVIDVGGFVLNDLSAAQAQGKVAKATKGKTLVAAKHDAITEAVARVRAFAAKK